jgi:uncharacterized SAM-binding protein YcdF (DUF218 family)
MSFRPKSLVFYFFFILGVTILFFHAKKIKDEPVNVWSQSSVQSLEADCAVVLTGAPGRIREGFELLQQKRIKKLIVSGVFKEATYTEVFPYWPYYNEVNPDDVILEKRSQTTFGNAHQSVVLVESLKCQDVLLVTSQLHMARAFSIFRDVFPNIIEIKKLTLPNGKSEQSVFDFAVELVKSLFYTVFGLVNFIGS